MPCNPCMSCIYNKAPCCPITKKISKKFQMSAKIDLVNSYVNFVTDFFS